MPQAAAPPVGEQELTIMVRSRKVFPEQQVLEILRSRGIGFRLTEAARVRLKKDGATPAIMAELERAAEALKRRTSAEVAAAAAAAAGPVVPPPPALDAAQQAKFLEEVRQNALDYTESLPNFICIQVTKRAIQFDGKGPWQSADTIQTRLAYNERKEEYQVISVNDRLTDRPYDSLGGTTSTGEFGTILHQLFAAKTATRFDYRGGSALRGRPVYEFDFMVAKDNSDWHISWQRVMTYVPAYRGRIAIDAETRQVLRLTQEAVGIPSDFPIREARSTLDYDYATIADRRYLLPLLASVELSESRFASRNEIQFRQYRRFTADTKLVFEEEPAAEPGKKPESTSEPRP